MSRAHALVFAQVDLAPLTLAAYRVATMSDTVIFVIVFVGLFVLRIIAATIVFLVLLPQGDRCLNCDAPTMRVASPVVDRLLPWFRKRWCLTCGWHGMLRRGPLSEHPARSEKVVTPR